MQFPTDLAPVSPATLEAFDRVARAAEESATAACLAHDDPGATMGAEAERMLLTGMGFVTRMLRASMTFAAGGILADELGWAQTRLPVYGVSHRMILDNFRRYDTALQGQLTAAEYAEIRPYLDYLKEAPFDVS